MSSEFEFDLNGPILSCPFSHSCNLPKSQSICGFPEYKLCPDFAQKLFQYKNKTRILH